MDREIIYNKAKAISETIKKIEESDIVNKMIVDSCNRLIQEAKTIEKDNLADLKEVSWDKDNGCASKEEIDFNLSQILAVFKKNHDKTGQI